LLKDIEIFEVSLVSNPAVPNAMFQLRKNADDSVEQFTSWFAICKVNKAKKQVAGYALVPNETDLQKHAILQPDLENAANSLMKQMAYGTQMGTGTGLEHQVFAGIGYPIQSAVDIDGSLGNANGFVTPIVGAWFLKVQITEDDVWEKIENGELRGFSIGGIAKLVPVDKSIVQSIHSAKKPDEKVPIGLTPEQLNKEARTVDEIVVDWDFDDELFKLLDALWLSIMEIYDDETIEDKKPVVRDTIAQFKEKVEALFSQIVQSTQMALSGALGQIERATEILKPKIILSQQKAKSEGGLKMDETKVNELIAKAFDERFGVDNTKLTKAIGDLLEKKLKEVVPATEKKESNNTEKTLKDEVDGLGEVVSVLVTKLSELSKSPMFRGGKPSDTTEGMSNSSETKKRGIPRKPDGSIDYSAIDKGDCLQFSDLAEPAEINK